jgi:hypothetical protein
MNHNILLRVLKLPYNHAVSLAQLSLISAAAEDNRALRLETLPHEIVYFYTTPGRSNCRRVPAVKRPTEALPSAWSGRSDTEASAAAEPRNGWLLPLTNAWGNNGCQTARTGKPKRPPPAFVCDKARVMCHDNNRRKLWI